MTFGILIAMLLLLHFATVVQTQGPIVTLENRTMVFGMTAPFTGPLPYGSELARGIQAAFYVENQYSVFKFVLIPMDDGGSSSKAFSNYGKLKAKDVFGLVSNYGTATNQQILSKMDSGTPYVGPYTSATFSSYSKNNKYKTASVFNTVPAIANEISVIVKYLTADWTVVQNTAILYVNDTAGSSAATALKSELRQLGLKMTSNFTYNHDAIASDSGAMKLQVQQALNVLMVPTPPRAIIYAGTIPEMAAELLKAAKERYTILGKAAPVILATSSIDIDALQAKMVNGNIFVSQGVPLPTDTGSQLVSDFQKAMNKTFPGTNFTSLALQGYVAGRIVIEATRWSVTRSDWPITREKWVASIKTVEEALDFGDWKVGPWSNKCNNSYRSSNCFCNTGVNTVYLARVSSSGIYQEPTTTSDFEACASSTGNGRNNNRNNNYGSKLVLLGQTVPVSGVDSYKGRSLKLGIQSALELSNNLASRTWRYALATLDSQSSPSVAAQSARTLLDTYGVPTLVGPMDTNTVEAIREEVSSSVPIIGSFSGLYKLRRPFVRNVINLRPSTYDETNVIAKYIAVDLDKTNVAIIYQKDELGTDYYDGAVLGLKAYGLTALAHESYSPVTRDTTNAVSITVNSGADTFILLGSPDVCASMIPTIKGSFSNSTNVTFFLVSYGIEPVQPALSAAGIPFNNVFYTAVLPASSTETELSTLYTGTIPTDDQSEFTYNGFFLGKFLTTMMTRVATSDVDQVTSEVLLEAIYESKIFDVSGVSVGPFSDSCSKDNTYACCNQGVSKVYLMKGNVRSNKFTNIRRFNYTTPTCGTIYVDKISNSNSNVGLIAGPTVALGAVLCALIGTTVALLLKKESVKDLTINNDEVQFLAEIGAGRYGKVFLATWKGTDVAVRIVNLQTAAADGSTVPQLKKEVFMMRKLRHPAILMILGFFERPNEFCIVTEFMQMGALDRILVSPTQLDTQTLLSLAADICKGAFFLHAQMPPIIHGSLTTASILVDSKLTAKITDIGLSADGKIKSRSYHGRYCAPEFSEKTTSLEPPVDVFSFGIILWEMFIPKELLVEYLSTHSRSAHSKSKGTASQSHNSSKGMSMQKADPFENFSIPASVLPVIGRMIRDCTAPRPDMRPTFGKVMESWSGVLEEAVGYSMLSLHTDSKTPGESGISGISVNPPTSIGSTLTSFDGPDQQP